MVVGTSFAKISTYPKAVAEELAGPVREAGQSGDERSLDSQAIEYRGTVHRLGTWLKKERQIEKSGIWHDAVSMRRESSGHTFGSEELSKPASKMGQLLEFCKRCRMS